MKRLAAVVLIALLSACSDEPTGKEFVYTPYTSCVEVWRQSGITEQQSFIRGKEETPRLAENVKHSLIAVCDKAKQFGARGGAVEDVMLMITRGAQKGLPDEAIKNQTFMAVSGWKIGQLMNKEWGDR